ncbi:serine protease inhibitor Cvsi-1-like [Mya arenaria]|uniref:serine protease inhibitor Cvsi-1-like n=1 Tax=Mya arenaria TaxID=6604 RepID=UPI0022E0B447|nr:serine protease inhibitor Cvsi-1-like [Mya arenaria]
MKVTLCLLVICVAIATVWGETCTNPATDCTHTSCPDNTWNQVCHSGQCTCEHATQTCSANSDCASNGNCRCFQNRCRCFGFLLDGK